jgi:hypothetical protein
MEFIGNNNDLFNLLKSEKIAIRNSVIVRINIFLSDGLLIIEIDFLYSKGQSLRLSFSKIKEYSFYHNSSYTFKYVENFNLIKDKGHFYLTLDPENELADHIEESDQDFILFEEFEAFYIDRIHQYPTDPVM